MNERGFTLVELMATILIIGVVIIVYSILLVNAQKKYLAGYFKDSRNVNK